MWKKATYLRERGGVKAGWELIQFGCWTICTCARVARVLDRGAGHDGTETTTRRRARRRTRRGLCARARACHY
eukprot:SAG11_NODE_1041_length_6056_cov_5.902468_7_plen_73_part_00